MYPRWRRPAVAALAAAGVAALVAGCGHGGTPNGGTPNGAGSAGGAAAASPAAARPHLRLCGTARTPANVPVKVEVAKGSVACAAALAVEHAYTKAVASGAAPGNGRGPVTVSGWTCQAFTTPVSLKTGDVSRCTRGGTEIITELPPP